MRKALAALAVVALTLALAACDDPKGSNHNTQRRPGAGQAQQPANPGPQAQQPAPVQGDPGAHNTQEGELDLHVEWDSENRRTPACEWSLNAPGRGHVCENMEPGEKAHPNDTNYLGFWEYETPAKAGDVVFLSAQGIGTKSLKCSYHWKGAYHPLPDDGGRHCGGTATLN